MKYAVLASLLFASAHAYEAGAVGTRVYAEGVNVPAHQQATPQKLVWAYTGAVTQGEAPQIYNAAGQVTVEDLLNTPINHISFIANVNVQNATDWFAPGKNNTGGCGQLQTYELPFGFNARNQSTLAQSLPIFTNNLKKLHDSKMTITLTLGSWCTQLPVLPSQKWTDDEFSAFVTYFQKIRTEMFGGYLDGIDFDWEGYCDAGCLKGVCVCGWDDDICGSATPAELAAGIKYQASPAPGQPPMQYQCWIMPTDTTFQVMTGITHAMKKAGYVVTLVPMSTSLYSGAEDTSTKQVMRNEYAKYRKQTSFGEEVDLLELADGILLQWYSGFDAALCKNSDDPKACTCDNVPDADYPNTLETKDFGGLLKSSWQTYWNVSGNMFPTSYPVRCQACGKNVILPNGTRGDLPCHQNGEDWYVPSMNRSSVGANPPAVVEEHNTAMAAYVAKQKSVPYWWVEGQTVNSKCPRGIDCPDWQYAGEERYSRQVKLLQSLSAVVDLSKISIGFETLGIDVAVQMEAWQDHALPWTTEPLKAHNPPTEYDNYTYYAKCTQNMTLDNVDQNKRCAMPLLSQQWGIKLNASDVVGLEAKVQSQLGKRLAGIGMFTLDGALSQPKGKTRRYWFAELMKLNETYQLPCYGDNCGSAGDDPFAPTPAPAPTPAASSGSYTVQAGDGCWSIADKLCHDGSSYAKDICNAATVCSALQAGQVITYDCSGTGAHC